ncbi:hypothetical protein Lal_00042112 [Lupinus albus]|nr:hypothetical protein Lal_00042112 [Lupinus albus]
MVAAIAIAAIAIFLNPMWPGVVQYDFHIMDYNVGDCDCEILETSVEVKQNTNGSVQEKESTNASQSEQKWCIPLTSQPEPKSGKALTSDVWRYFEKAGIVDGKEKARASVDTTYKIMTPLSLNVSNFITLKLSSTNYPLWREQALALAESQDLVDLTATTSTPSPCSGLLPTNLAHSLALQLPISPIDQPEQSLHVEPEEPKHSPHHLHTENEVELVTPIDQPDQSSQIEPKQAGLSSHHLHTEHELLSPTSNQHPEPITTVPVQLPHDVPVHSMVTCSQHGIIKPNPKYALSPNLKYALITMPSE